MSTEEPYASAWTKYIATEQDNLGRTPLFDAVLRALGKARPGVSHEYKRVIDIGCGTGIAARMLQTQRAGLREYYGLDRNKALLDIASRHLEHLDLKHLDATLIHKDFSRDPDLSELAPVLATADLILLVRFLNNLEDLPAQRLLQALRTYAPNTPLLIVNPLYTDIVPSGADDGFHGIQHEVDFMGATATHYARPLRAYEHLITGLGYKLAVCECINARQNQPDPTHMLFMTTGD